MRCQVHGSCPTQDQVASFVAICKKFMHEHPEELIGMLIVMESLELLRHSKLLKDIYFAFEGLQ